MRTAAHLSRAVAVWSLLWAPESGGHAAESKLADPWWRSAGRVYELAGPKSTAVLPAAYPTDDVRLDLILSFIEPGTVMGAWGLNGLVAGDWALCILDDDRVALAVYAPAARSRIEAREGWHVLVSPEKLKRGEDQAVSVVVKEGEIGLFVGSVSAQREPLVVKLSGSPIRMGGRGGAGEPPPMRGEVRVAYLGPFAPQIGPEQLKRSALVERSGVSPLPFRLVRWW